MKMCNNCKRVVDDNQSFCQYCGKNSFENITLHSEDEIKLELQQKRAEKEAKKRKKAEKFKKSSNFLCCDKCYRIFNYFNCRFSA